jgi:AraC-like DNA-binding protein
LYIGAGFKRYTVGAGTAVILPGGVRRYGYRECTEETEFFWVHFRGEIGTLPQRSKPDEERMIALFSDLLLYARMPDYPYDACTCTLKLILYEIARAGASDSESPNARIYAICKWIRENGTKPLKVSDVAAHFNYNEDYITRIFKKHYSAGIKAYIDEVRLKRIRELLLSTDMKIKDIAAACGFDDSKSFQKFFKYHEGMTAAAYRELYFGSKRSASKVSRKATEK